MEFKYNLITQEEAFGDTSLRLTTLQDLNQTIDLVFDELFKTGDQGRLESLCPYFGVVWPSARGLAQWLLGLRKVYGDFGGMRALEIGCGLAIPSLILARFGADVLATDCHPDVPNFLKLNSEANLSSAEQERLKYMDLNWLDLSRLNEKFSLVVGSDILYERQHPELVARALLHYVSEDGSIIVADPGRPYLQTFVTAMEDLGCKYQLESLTVKDSPGTKDIFLFRFKRG